MKYRVIKKITWWSGAITFLCICWFLIGFTFLGIEPMRNQALISSVMLLITGVCLVVDQIFWQRKKNPRPLRLK